MQIFGSDSKLSHLDQQSETGHSDFSKINVCLIMTGNDRLEKVTPSLELVRISNHAIKGMIEVNSWKNRGTIFQLSEINHVIWWVVFYCTNVLQIACVSLRLSEGRFACLTLLLVLVTKWNIVVFYTGHLAYLLDSLVCYQTMTCKNLAMCWGELSAVIAWLTSKCLWSRWKW